LIVTNYLPPKIGGIERISHELATALNKIPRVEVHVATAEWPARYVESSWNEIDYVYKVVYFPSITIFRRLPIPNLFNPEFWRKMSEINQNYDITFFQSHLFILNWILALKLRRVKRRIWMNQGCNYVPLNSFIARCVSFLYERIGMFVMKRFCNEFLGQSVNTAKWISKRVRIPFKVLPNATNLNSFQTNPNFVNSELKTKVLFVGRLVEGKGILECIQAISKANDELMRVGEDHLFTLSIVGSGPLINRINGLARNVETRIYGEVSHSEVIKSMYESDILIQAYSQSEGLTTVTLEGLATGMIIVTTPLSGDSKMSNCPNYIHGELREIPDLLLRARRLAKTRNSLFISGRDFILSGHTWEAIAKRLIFKKYSDVDQL
jgi:glycosyltransferase involved in cell wall biosynthesis